MGGRSLAVVCSKSLRLAEDGSDGRAEETEGTEGMEGLLGGADEGVLSAPTADRVLSTDRIFFTKLDTLSWLLLQIFEPPYCSVRSQFKPSVFLLVVPSSRHPLFFSALSQVDSWSAR